jgi:hypothetical protein
MNIRARRRQHRAFKSKVGLAFIREMALLAVVTSGGSDELIGSPAAPPHQTQRCCPSS